MRTSSRTRGVAVMGGLRNGPVGAGQLWEFPPPAGNSPGPRPAGTRFATRLRAAGRTRPDHQRDQREVVSTPTTPLGGGQQEAGAAPAAVGVDELLRRYAPRVYSLAYRLLG